MNDNNNGDNNRIRPELGWSAAVFSFGGIKFYCGLFYKDLDAFTSPFFTVLE